MSQKYITQVTAQTDALADGDLFLITDVSDTSERSDGTNKKLTFTQIKSGMDTAGYIKLTDISVTDSGGDGSLSYNNSTGVITYTGPSASEVRAHISVTDSGGDGSLSYSSSTGVITYTGPSASEVRSHLSVGTESSASGDGAIAYNSSTGVFTYTPPTPSGIGAITASSTDTLTNKTFDANGTGNSISNIETPDVASASKTGSDTKFVTGTEGTNGNLLQWNADGDAVDSSLATADVVTGSSTDTFTNKTFDANATGNSLSNVEVADLASSAKTGSDTKVVTGTAGTSGDLAQWNGDGDLVDGPTPPSGTIVGTSDSQALTNKTIDGDLNTLQDIAYSSIKSTSRTGSDVKLVTGTAGTSGDLSIWNADGDLVDGPTPPTGTIVGTSDSQTLTNKTIDANSNTITNIGASEVESGIINGQTESTNPIATDTILVYTGSNLRKVQLDNLPPIYKLGELRDVTLQDDTNDSDAVSDGSLNNGELLVYDASNDIWVNDDTLIVDHQSQLVKAGDLIYDNLPSVGNAKLYFEEVTNTNGKHFTIETSGISSSDTDGSTGGNLILSTGGSQSSTSGETTGSVQIVTGGASGSAGATTGSITIQTGDVASGTTGSITLRTGMSSSTDVAGNIVFDLGQDGDGVTYSDAIPETTKVFNFGTASKAWKGLYSNAAYFVETGAGSNYVAFTAPSSIASNITWTLPATDGSNGQVLSTNGSGTLSWATAAGGSGDITAVNITTDSGAGSKASDTSGDADFSLLGGDGVSVTNSGATITVALADPDALDQGSDIDETVIATDDRLLIWDETASNWKYVTIDNLQDEIDTDTGIALTDLSVGAEAAASGDGAISYNNSTGVFTYTPPTAAGISAITASSTDTLTNKTFDANGTGNSLSNVETADLASTAKTGADTKVVTGTEGTNGNLIQWNADGDAVDASLAVADVVTGSSTDTFTNKTFDANGTGNSLSNVETADIASGSKSGSDTTLVTGTAGTNGNLVSWNADGDAVDSSIVASNVALSDGDTYTGTHDFGGATLEIPNAAAPSLSVAGQIALDTTTTDHTALLKYHDGTNEFVIPAILTSGLSTTDNDVIAYNAANNRFEMEAQSGSGGGISNVVEDTTPQLGGQLDVNGNAIGDGTRELLTFTEDASAVNHVNIENQATGGGPIISAAGDDTNIDLNLAGKGTGNISLGNMTFDADQSIGSGQDNYVLTYDHSAGTISLEAASGGGGISNVVEDTTPQLGGMLDVNGQAIGDGTRELLTFTEDGSAVNHINIENQATGSGPIISAAGDDTNVDLNISAKGTGTILGGKTQLTNSSAAQLLVRGWGPDSTGNDGGAIQLGEESAFHGLISYDNATSVLYIDNAYNSNNGDIGFRTKTAGTAVTPLRLKGSGQTIINGTSALATATIYGHDAADEALVIKAASGQTADLVEIQNNSGTKIFSINSIGSILNLSNSNGVISHTGNQFFVRRGTSNAKGFCMDVFGPNGFRVSEGEHIGFADFTGGFDTAANTTIRRIADAHLAINGASATDTCQVTVGSNTSLGTLTIYGHSASDETLVVRAASSQSADILQIQNSGGTELVTVDSSGKLGINSASPNATLTVNGSMSLPIESISATDTLDDSNHTVLVNASGGSRTVNLPAASGSTGKVFIIKKTDSSSNNVVIDPNASETIDGSSTFTFNAQYRAVTIQCDGSNWHIISSYIVNY